MECSICYLPLVLFIGALPCGHTYHNYCIQKWSSISNSCPLCRSKFNYLSTPSLNFRDLLHKIRIVQAGEDINEAVGVKTLMQFPVEKGQIVSLNKWFPRADYISINCPSKLSWIKCCSPYQDFYVKADRKGIMRVEHYKFKSSLVEEVRRVQEVSYVVDGNFLYRGRHYKLLNK